MAATALSEISRSVPAILNVLGSLPAFVLAVLLISASPGPAMALIFRRAALRGVADDLFDFTLSQPLWWVIFYAIFVAGLVYFAIAPAVDERSARTAIVRGAAFGFVTYATWDLTSLAVLADFPAALVPVDLAWGAVLSASVATVTTAVALRVPALGVTAAQPTRP